MNKKNLTIVNALFFTGILLGCGGGSGEDSSDDPQVTPPITLPDGYQANTGRLLGAQCAQCHGTNGYSVTNWDSIAGEGEFAHKNFSEYPIMQAQADGYTDMEKVAIDAWLNTLSENEQDNDSDNNDDNDNDED